MYNLNYNVTNCRLNKPVGKPFVPSPRLDPFSASLVLAVPGNIFTAGYVPVFNQKSEWDDILLSLDKIMLYYIQDKNFDFVKVIKENKMGMRFESNSVWNSWGSLDWEDKRINQGFIGLFY